MSDWAYVTGIIKADVPSRTNAETMYLAQTVIDHLPKITGSESNVHVHVYLEDGYNRSSNTDEFFNHSNLGNEEYFSMFSCQSRVIITLSGHLRDRKFEETLKEANHFLCRLAKRMSIYDCLVRVWGDEKEHIFTNKNDWLSKMYSWGAEEQWTDYLRWSPVRDDEDNLIGGKPMGSIGAK